MVCPTPKLDLDAVRNKRRKRDITQAGLNMIKPRAIRATTMDGLSIIVDNVEITVVILIDGENITLEEFRNELPMLRAYEDPVLQSFNGQDRTLTFVSVWPKSERSIDIKVCSLHFILYLPDSFSLSTTIESFKIHLNVMIYLVNVIASQTE